MKLGDAKKIEIYLLNDGNHSSNMQKKTINCVRIACEK